MKKTNKPKVIYKQSKNLSEAERQQRVNRAFDILFDKVDRGPSVPCCKKACSDIRKKMC